MQVIIQDDDGNTIRSVNVDGPVPINTKQLADAASAFAHYLRRKQVEEEREGGDTWEVREK